MLKDNTILRIDLNFSKDHDKFILTTTELSLLVSKNASIVNKLCK